MPVDASEVLGRATSATTLLLATDFDGTISAIAATPGAAAPLPGAVEALAALRTAHGVHVAVVSGRRYHELAQLTAPIGAIWRVAEHGSVIEAPRRAPVTEVARAHQTLVGALLATAREITALHRPSDGRARQPSSHRKGPGAEASQRRALPLR